jgi:hypothetical protein
MSSAPEPSVTIAVAEVKALFDDRERLRWESFHQVAASLDRRGALAVPADEAADVLFALAGPQLHELLRARGWSDRKWREWTVATLQMRLLRPADAKQTARPAPTAGHDSP